MPNNWLDDGIKAVVFDAVGTVLFPAIPVTETYRTIARKHAAEIDATVLRGRLRESFEKQERIDYRAGWRTNEEREVERWKTIIRECLPDIANLDACFADLWEWYRSPTAWSVHPEAESVLQELVRRQLVVGIASNFDARLAGIVNGIPALKPLVDLCVISSLVGWRKPSAEFFKEVIAKAGRRANEILFVGDDLRNDYRGAQAAGMRAALFDPTDMTATPGSIARLSDIL